MKRDLAIRELKMAIAFRAPRKGYIHHTDRRSQYCSNEYQLRLSKHGFKASPSCLMILAVSMRIWNSCAARHLCQAAAEVGPFPSWSLRTVAE